jgi:hypothetical protein
VRKIGGEKRAKHSGARNAEGATCPPDMEALVRGLLARAPFADALYADRSGREPVLDQ